MSKPSKPETPVSETEAQKNQVYFGKKGNQLVKKVGTQFVLDNKRDRSTRERGKGSADIAIANRDSQRKTTGANKSKIAKIVSGVATEQARSTLAKGTAGEVAQGQNIANGASSTVTQLRDTTRSAMNISEIDSMRSMDKMRRQFKTANDVVDVAAASAGYGMAHYDIGKSRSSYDPDNKVWDEKGKKI